MEHIRRITIDIPDGVWRKLLRQARAEDRDPKSQVCAIIRRAVEASDRGVLI